MEPWLVSYWKRPLVWQIAWPNGQKETIQMSDALWNFFLRNSISLSKNKNCILLKMKFFFKAKKCSYMAHYYAQLWYSSDFGTISVCNLTYILTYTSRRWILKFFRWMLPFDDTKLLQSKCISSWTFNEINLRRTFIKIEFRFCQIIIWLIYVMKIPEQN